MIRRRRKPICTLPQEMTITELWLLRILAPMGGHKNLVTRGGFSNDNVARAAGLGAWLDDGDRDFDSRVVRTEIKEKKSTAIGFLA